MAMRNRSSSLTTIGITTLAILVVGGWAVNRMLNQPETAGQPSVSGGTGAVRQIDEARPVGNAMNDQANETVQALANSQESLRTRFGSVEAVIGGMREDWNRLTEEISGLRADQEALGEQASSGQTYEEMREGLLGEVRNLIQGVEDRLVDDFPVTEEPVPDNRRGELGPDGYLWHAATGPTGFTGVGTGLSGTGDTLLSTVGTGGQGDPFALDGGNAEPVPPVPVYTIPPDAALVGSRGLTALIGRVPLNGQVASPLPFKVITGAENLLANGQQLPELHQAIWSGVAVGDSTLHCVSGRIQQVTFLFRDGSIASQSGTLGWISDEQGYPCIPGRFVSNLRESIAGLSAAAVASSLTQSLSEQETTTVADGGTVTRYLTGDPTRYALGRGVSGGINEWAKIIQERAREAFDAVIVPPGQELTVHVDQAIAIDWPPEGRRVRHVTSVRSDRSHRSGSGGLD